MNTTWQRLPAALAMAAELHAAQSRKGSRVPYVAHLLAVTSLVLEHGGDEDEAIAAALHDAVEDQGGAATRAEILRRFGERVTAIVDGCTDTDQTPKPPWQQRKEAYLAALETADRSVLLVSAADKVHNLQSIVSDYRQLGEALWDRFSGGRSGTLWYFRTVTDLVGRRLSSPLADQLATVMTELEQLAGEATAR